MIQRTTHHTDHPPLLLAAVGITLVAFLQAGLAPIAAVLLQIWVALGAALLFQVCRCSRYAARQAAEDADRPN